MAAHLACWSIPPVPLLFEACRQSRDSAPCGSSSVHLSRVRQRAAEEHSGIVRWLRPEYQHSEGPSQATLQTDIEIEIAPVLSKKRDLWPATLTDQVRAIRAALAEQQGTIGAELLARRFTRTRAGRVEEILKTLASLGQAREVDGRYVV